MKILLTGSTGQLGREILKSTPKEIEIINPGRDELDLSDYESCKKIVLKIRPDWIINCGAYTAVDAAEKDIQICKKINSFAPQAFSEVINETNSKLLQISTDFVFNGEQNFPYQENQEKKHEEKSEKKVGRNEKCPCGSGKKFKHCHGNI